MIEQMWFEEAARTLVEELVVAVLEMEQGAAEGHRLLPDGRRSRATPRPRQARGPCGVDRAASRG
jgi:hypothetical protein